jgi:hypothetical protein
LRTCRTLTQAAPLIRAPSTGHRRVAGYGTYASVSCHRFALHSTVGSGKQTHYPNFGNALTSARHFMHEFAKPFRHRVVGTTELWRLECKVSNSAINSVTREEQRYSGAHNLDALTVGSRQLVSKILATPWFPWTLASQAPSTYTRNRNALVAANSVRRLARLGVHLRRVAFGEGRLGGLASGIPGSRRPHGSGF